MTTPDPLSSAASGYAGDPKPVNRAPLDVAWALVLDLAPRLSRQERNTIFAKVGAGEAYDVIEEVLITALRRRLRVTDELLWQVSDLSRAYLGDPGRTLQRLVEGTRGIQEVLGPPVRSSDLPCLGSKAKRGSRARTLPAARTPATAEREKLKEP